MSPIPCENIDNNAHSTECQEQSSDSNNYSDIDLDVNNEFETKSLNILNCQVASEAIRYNVIVLPINQSKNDDPNVKQKPVRTVCCSITYLSFGLMLLTAGIITIAFPIYDLVLEERLKMQPGLPPYEQWVIPQPEVRLRVFIFEAENPNEFLDGTDEKLRLKEIGPIVYREHLHHKDVVFHENSTLSYTAARRIEFLEDQNEPGILNRTILVPNFVVLASAASINGDSIQTFFFEERLNEPLFLNITIYDYLWRYESDFIKTLYNMNVFGINIGQFFVPTNNSGVLYQIYEDFNDRYNVRIGPGYSGDHFFEITSVNGDSVVPGFHLDQNECNASIVGSTEGALYKTHLNEDSVLWYWRKALCRQVPLYFEKKVQKGSFEAYKYVLRENVYDRMDNLTEDCYSGAFEELPDGLSDLSKCFYDMPFAASNPHFYGRYPNPLTEKLDGFKPDKDKHQSFIIIEPVMGVPIDQSARSQSNVILPEFKSNFRTEIQRFSNMALPTFWVEFHQKKLTTGIENLLYFTLFILPVLQYVIPIALLVSGLLLIINGVRGCISNQTYNLHHSLKPKQTKRTKTSQLLEKIPNTWHQTNTKSDLCIKA